MDEATPQARAPRRSPEDAPADAPRRPPEDAAGERLWRAAGATGAAVTAAPRVRRRLRHYPHQHVRFSCSYSVPGISSACFVQQTPIGRHQESHCGGEAPSQLAKPLVSFFSSREFPRAAHLSPRRMSTYRSLLRKSAVFGNQMRIRISIPRGVLRQGRRLFEETCEQQRSQRRPWHAGWGRAGARRLFRFLAERKVPDGQRYCSAIGS